MKRLEIIRILGELIKHVEEFDKIKYESTDRQRELHNKISELYGSIQEYYIEATGEINIEVPIAGSQLKSTYKNYFEAGYLSGRTFHAHQGYMELLKVFGAIKSNKNFTKENGNKMIKSFSKTEIIGILSVILVLIGGAFWFGKFIGENRFDQKKIDLTEENKLLKADTLALRKTLASTKDSILIYEGKISSLQSETPIYQPVHTENISYYKPKSIFEGKVFIKAEDSFKKKLEFKGISGLDKNLNGSFKESSIEVDKGDRFFIKLENDEIWVINVIDILAGIDIELYKK